MISRINLGVRSLAAATAVGVGLGVIALTGSPAAADTPPVVSAVKVINLPSGGLTPFIPLYCVERIKFNDDTPSAPENYTATVQTDAQPATTVGSYNGAVRPDSGRPSFMLFDVPCGDLVDGTGYSVAVTEAGGSTGNPTPFVYEIVGHPNRSTVTDQVSEGVYGWKPGVQQTVSFSDGTWEPGLTYSTQLWIGKTREFTGADFAANRDGTDAIIESYRTASPVLKFTVPTTAQGKYGWYSVAGYKAGKAAWRITFSAIPIIPLPAQRTSWVTSFGRIEGAPPTARREIRATPVVFSSAGRAQNLKVQYQWFKDSGRAIPDATHKSYTPTLGDRGHDLALRVRVVDNDRAPRTKVFSLGRVK